MFYIIEFEKLTTLQEEFGGMEPEELECAFGVMCLQVMVADTGVDEIIRGTDGGETEGGEEPKRRRQKTIAACVLKLLQNKLCLYLFS